MRTGAACSMRDAACGMRNMPSEEARGTRSDQQPPEATTQSPLAQSLPTSSPKGIGARGVKRRRLIMEPSNDHATSVAATAQQRSRHTLASACARFCYLRAPLPFPTCRLPSMRDCALLARIGQKKHWERMKENYLVLITVLLPPDSRPVNAGELLLSHGLTFNAIIPLKVNTRFDTLLYPMFEHHRFPTASSA